jgi:outer membrane protein OmpA-like peptidoglycan-associated protein/tetratricopeptide (TPR) repeat protein
MDKTFAGEWSSHCLFLNTNFPLTFVVMVFKDLHCMRFTWMNGLIILACFVLSTKTLAQSVYTPPKIPEKVQKRFDSVILASKAGHADDAIPELNEFIDRYPTWTEPRHELSRIYYEAGKKNEAISTLEQAIVIDTLSQLKQVYTLARLYEETGETEKAKACYHTYINKAAVDDPLKQKALEALDQFETRQQMFSRKYDITLIPLPNEINTENHESVGRWTLDGRELFFSRVVNGQEDLFIGTLDSTTQLWKVKPYPYNTSSNEGAPAISPDGKYLLFTACNLPDGYGSCDLYVSVRKNGIWSKPVNMGPGFNTRFWDGQPCFGLDGGTIYFSSNRDGTFGGRDIWYMYQISGDSWSKPISAGPNINTANNEGCPFVSFDGNTLYFMRDGKGGFGESDLYISRKGLDGKWMPAENMGPPINTPQSEGALAVHPNGKRAMLTRLTNEQKFDLFEFDLPPEFISPPQQALHVFFKDRITGAPLKAQLEIFEALGNPDIRLSQWSTDEGHIIVTLKRDTPYGIIANTAGYLMYSANLDPDSSASRSIVINMTPMEKAEHETVPLENIFFDVGSSTLLPASEPELQKLLYTLKINQSMIIEIRGHTDNVGDEASNQALSEARAKAVFIWLTNKGIPGYRISYKGFGESQPVASNDTEEGRQLNRRTEFYIVKK